MKPMPVMPLEIVPTASITTPSSPLTLKRASIVSWGKKCISLTASATVSGFGAQARARAKQSVHAFRKHHAIGVDDSALAIRPHADAYAVGVEQELDGVAPGFLRKQSRSTK